MNNSWIPRISPTYKSVLRKDMTICSCPLCDIFVGFLLSMSWEHHKIIYKPSLLANNLNTTEIFISYKFTRIAPIKMTGIVALSQSSFSTIFSILFIVIGEFPLCLLRAVLIILFIYKVINSIHILKFICIVDQ